MPLKVKNGIILNHLYLIQPPIGCRWTISGKCFEIWGMLMYLMVVHHPWRQLAMPALHYLILNCHHMVLPFVIIFETIWRLTSFWFQESELDDLIEIVESVNDNLFDESNVNDVTAKLEGASSMDIDENANSDDFEKPPESRHLHSRLSLNLNTFIGFNPWEMSWETTWFVKRQKTSYVWALLLRRLIWS